MTDRGTWSRLTLNAPSLPTLEVVGLGLALALSYVFPM